MIDKLPSDIILYILDYSQKYKYDNCYLVSKYLYKVATKKYVKDCIRGIKLESYYLSHYYVKYAQYYEDIENYKKAQKYYCESVFWGCSAYRLRE